MFLVLDVDGLEKDGYTEEEIKKIKWNHKLGISINDIINNLGNDSEIKRLRYERLSNLAVKVFFIVSFIVIIIITIIERW